MLCVAFVSHVLNVMGVFMLFDITNQLLFGAGAWIGFPITVAVPFIATTMNRHFEAVSVRSLYIDGRRRFFTTMPCGRLQELQSNKKVTTQVAQ